MTISIIIPTYNEASYIGALIRYLLVNGRDEIEIIVSDGGSTDDTLRIAKEAGAKAVVSPGKGRSAQMNFGANLSKGDVLYFVHADCFPPKDFAEDIYHAISENYDMGRYRTKFDSQMPILKLNEWFTGFDLFICMGGDQTLFVLRSLFIQCKGFNEDMMIMEEYDFCLRARKTGRYKIFNKATLISARKYETNTWLEVQLANSKIMRMYKRGASQKTMSDTYKQMLQYRNSAD